MNEANQWVESAKTLRPPPGDPAAPKEDKVEKAAVKAK